MSDDSNVGHDLPDGAGDVLDGTGVVTSPPPAAAGGGAAAAARAPASGGRGAQQQQQRAPKRKQEPEPEYDEGDLGDGPASKRPKAAEGAKGAEGGAEGGDEGMEEAEGEEGGEEGGAEEPEADPTFTPGCLVHFSLETELPEMTGPRVISDVFGGRDKVKFVEYDGDMSDDSNVGHDLPDGAGDVLDGTGVVTSPPPAAAGGGAAAAARAPASGGRGAQQQQQRAPKRKQEPEPEYDEGDLGDGPASKRPKAAEGAKGAEGGAEGGDEGMEEAEGEEGGEEGGAEEPEADPTFTPGCLVHFSLETELPEMTGPRVISDVFGGRDKVKFVELLEGRKGGYLRFITPELAAAALADFVAREEEARTVAGIKGAMKAVEGEEEMSYYKR
ncbi:hypothetical protein TSOC_012603, partial [Tetrabaena socialis]